MATEDDPASSDPSRPRRTRRSPGSPPTDSAARPTTPAHAIRPPTPSTSASRTASGTTTVRPPGPDSGQPSSPATGAATLSHYSLRSSSSSSAAPSTAPNPDQSASALGYQTAFGQHQHHFAHAQTAVAVSPYGTTVLSAGPPPTSLPLPLPVASTSRSTLNYPPPQQSTSANTSPSSRTAHLPPASRPPPSSSSTARTRTTTRGRPQSRSRTGSPAESIMPFRPRLEPASVAVQRRPSQASAYLAAQASALAAKTVVLNDSPAFSMLVLGCGGGPLETNLSSYLIKSHDAEWEEGCVCLEGGSGIGAISALLSDPTTTTSFADFRTPSTTSSILKATHVFSCIRAFCISHAHADHVQGLVISCGTSTGRKDVVAGAQTIRNLEHVFDGGVWPKLAGHEDIDMLHYRYRPYPDKHAYMNVTRDIHLAGMPISHGTSTKESSYESTAFFVSNAESRKEFLFFGDVEPDSIAKEPRNLEVWRQAAARIKAGKLSTIFIECSYPTSQPRAQLWGHLSPPYIFEELKVLASLLDPTSDAYYVEPTDPASVLWQHKEEDEASNASGEAVQLEYEMKAAGPTKRRFAKAEEEGIGGAADLRGRPGASEGGGAIKEERGSKRMKRTNSYLDAANSLKGKLIGVNVCIIHVKDEIWPSVSDVVSSMPAVLPGTPTASGNPNLPAHSHSHSPTTRRVSAVAATAQTSEGGSGAQSPSLLLQTPFPDVSARERIFKELLSLEEIERLGMRFVMCEPGMRIDI